MKPRLFPLATLGSSSMAGLDSSPACRVRVRLQVRTATQAGSVLPEFPAALPATPLPDEKIHRFHPARYGLGLVLASHSQPCLRSTASWPRMPLKTGSDTDAGKSGGN